MTMIALDSTARNARTLAPEAAKPAMVVRVARSAREALALWWAMRTAGAYDDAFFKDVGVPRCGLENAVRYGRALRRDHETVTGSRT